MTLGWPEFVALAAALCTIAAVLTTLMEREISEALARFRVRQYEQALGFEVGLVQASRLGPKTEMWGIARVTPGGVMDRAGMRSGDLVFDYHGYSFNALRWAIGQAESGGTACVVVHTANDFRRSSARDVCLKMPPKEPRR